MSSYTHELHSPYGQRAPLLDNSLVICPRCRVEQDQKFGTPFLTLIGRRTAIAIPMYCYCTSSKRPSWWFILNDHKGDTTLTAMLERPVQVDPACYSPGGETMPVGSWHGALPTLVPPPPGTSLPPAPSPVPVPFYKCSNCGLRARSTEFLASQEESTGWQFSTHVPKPYCIACGARVV